MYKEIYNLEFSNLIIVESTDDSKIGKYINGTNISIGSDIIIDNSLFNVDHIIQEDDNIYRFINSNETLIVQKIN